MCIMKVFINCIFWAGHISLYKRDLSYLRTITKIIIIIFIIIIYILLSRLILYFACSYLMTSSISSLVDLRSTK